MEPPTVAWRLALPKTVLRQSPRRASGGGGGKVGLSEVSGSASGSERVNPTRPRDRVARGVGGVSADVRARRARVDADARAAREPVGVWGTVRPLEFPRLRQQGGS